MFVNGCCQSVLDDRGRYGVCVCVRAHAYARVCVCVLHVHVCMVCSARSAAVREQLK